MLDIKQIEPFYPENLRPFKRNLLREYVQYKILETQILKNWPKMWNRSYSTQKAQTKFCTFPSF